MKWSLFSGRIGAIVIVLGVLLIVGGDFLPSHGDYEWQVSSVVDRTFLVVGPLIMLAISVYCWFWRVRGVLFVLSLLLIILALLFHCFLEFVYRILLCFDTCPPGPINIGAGFWLPLVGYVLGGVGLLIAKAAKSGIKVKGVAVSK